MITTSESDGAVGPGRMHGPDRLVLPNAEGPRLVGAAPLRHLTTRVGGDLDTEPTRRSEQARYLAALALGLLSAGWDQREVVAELETAADGCATLLDQAARLVYPMKIGDAQQRQRARGVLLDAASQVRLRPRPRQTEAGRHAPRGGSIRSPRAPRPRRDLPS